VAPARRLAWWLRPGTRETPANLLEGQGNYDKAQQASQRLPDQVDTGNGRHAGLLSKLGRDPATSVISWRARKFSNLLGGERRGGLAGMGGVGRRQRVSVWCCPSGLPDSTASLWIRLNPAAVPGTAGPVRRDAVVLPALPRGAGHRTARWWHSWSSAGLQLMMSR
jgi:hypothetical protein